MAIKTYLKEIYRRSPNKMHANWELSKTLKVGDVGKMENGVFVTYSSLSKKGVTVKIRKDPKEERKLDLSSESGVTIKPMFEAKGDAKVVDLKGEAAFLVSFQKANSYVFRTSGIQSEYIENLESVENAIIALNEYGSWKDDYVVVTEIVIADAVTILLSKEGGVSTKLKATGTFELFQMDIADASVGFQASSTSALALEIVGKKNTTPLFKVKKLKIPFFGEPQLESKGTENSNPSSADLEQPSPRLIDITVEEFE